MSKRVSPAVIGAFVVVSVAILVVALIVVGSGRLFAKPVRFICMFQGNLNGLKIGAPVKVRGVQIGTVAAIELRLLPSQGRIRPSVRGLRLPVIIDVDRSQMLARGGTGEALETAGFEDLVKQGLRAQLATGLYVRRQGLRSYRFAVTRLMGWTQPVFNGCIMSQRWQSAIEKNCEGIQA
jgi:paraquat-inducible protein B